jgi:signal transduction histidine kinase
MLEAVAPGLVGLGGTAASWALWQRTHDAWSLAAGLGLSLASAVLLGVVGRARARAAEAAAEKQRVERRLAAAVEEEDRLRRQIEQLEARVRERTAQLEDAILEFETFNYSVSHDLRSPLGAIINLSAILGEDFGDGLDADGRDCVRRIVSSASAALSLTDGILAFARSGSPARAERLPMRTIFEEVAAEIRAAAPDSGCAIRVGDVPDVYGDPEMIRIVVANLLGNACKFVPKGRPPEVEVGGGVSSDQVIYFVRDRGIGFDDGQRGRLFKTFERVHRSPDYSGHGLGLAIVARIVRRHGGHVWAQGKPDRGATFFFSLPKRTPEAGDVPADARAPASEELSWHNPPP